MIFPNEIRSHFKTYMNRSGRKEKGPAERVLGKGKEGKAEEMVTVS